MTVGAASLITPKDRRPRGVDSLSISDIELPLIDIGLRTNIVNYMDIGVNLNLPSTLGFNLKKQFFDFKHFAAAVSVGVSHVLFTTSAIEENKGIRNRFFDFNTSLLLTIDISRNFGINFSFPFILRKDPYSSEKAFFLTGLNIGFRMGDAVGSFVEGALIYDTSSRQNAVSIGMGFYFGSASSAPGFHEEKSVLDFKESKKIEGKLIKYIPKNKIIIFTNSAFYTWRESDRVCIIREEEQIACGTIYKVKKAFAMAKLNYTFKIPLLNDTVRLENE